MFEDVRIHRVEELEKENSKLHDDIKRIWEIAYGAPELNLQNYSQDDVEKLNNNMVELFNFVDDIT